MKDVIQKTLTAGAETTFEMKLQRCAFLVKNFTDDQITVRLGDNDAVSIIGAGSWEKVFNNIENSKYLPDATKIVKITANKDGMVEVASVDD
jgi:hypothetical protein|nr:MAG TPA: hypothetical protein [Bacteriophage sp.]